MNPVARRRYPASRSSQGIRRAPAPRDRRGYTFRCLCGRWVKGSYLLSAEATLYQRISGKLAPVDKKKAVCRPGCGRTLEQVDAVLEARKAEGVQLWAKP